MAVEELSTPEELRPTVRLRHSSKFVIGDLPGPALGLDETETDFHESTPASSAHSPKHQPSSSQTAIYSGFFSFFLSEITRGYALENDEARYAEKRKKVYAFIKIPKELEKFLFYGLLQCTDAFLYIFTFLPLRFFMALYHLLIRWTCWKPMPVSPSERCDILKVRTIKTHFSVHWFCTM